MQAAVFHLLVTFPLGDPPSPRQLPQLGSLGHQPTLPYRRPVLLGQFLHAHLDPHTPKDLHILQDFHIFLLYQYATPSSF